VVAAADDIVGSPAQCEEAVAEVRNLVAHSPAVEVEAGDLHALHSAGEHPHVLGAFREQAEATDLPQVRRTRFHRTNCRAEVAAVALCDEPEGVGTSCADLADLCHVRAEHGVPATALAAYAVAGNKSSARDSRKHHSGRSRHAAGLSDRSQKDSDSSSMPFAVD
jgi:hypothetical protein